ncbi:hypothetical protein KR074_011108 [Drosophila pseudoananassae]|nr:hypothetical protein KR074_011108 [Drosophila pseudoananassae]
MGKYPSVVVLATALAFCAFCPFFGRCNDTDRNDIIKVIDSFWSEILVKYQAEFDNNVKFTQLQEAIDEIVKAMLDYKGEAKDKLPLIRSLKSDARLTYENYVGPVFHWCRSINSTFDTFIRYLRDGNMSEIDKNTIGSLAGYALELGFKETAKSIEFLTSYLYKIKELQNEFRHISHDVQYDFGPGGVYGKEKAELQERISNIWIIFDFTPEKKTLTEHLKHLEEFFSVLMQKIKNASEIVKDMEIDPEEDRLNLHKLREVISNANNRKSLSYMTHTFLRVQFIPYINNLMDSCAEHVSRHKYEALL